MMTAFSALTAALSFFFLCQCTVALDCTALYEKAMLNVSAALLQKVESHNALEISNAMLGECTQKCPHLPYCFYTKAVLTFHVLKYSPVEAEANIKSAVSLDPRTFLPALCWIYIETGKPGKAFNILLRLSRFLPGLGEEAGHETGKLVVFRVPSVPVLIAQLCKTFDKPLCHILMGKAVRRTEQTGVNTEDQRRIAYSTAYYLDKLHFQNHAWAHAMLANEHMKQEHFERHGQDSASNVPRIFRNQMLYLDVMSKMFTKPFLETVALHAKPLQISDHPVFILGLPRSGSSLVEQILGTNENITNFGETEIVSNIVPDIEVKAVHNNIPQFTNKNISHVIHHVTQRFHEEIRKLVDLDQYQYYKDKGPLGVFTEKTNQNFRYLPLLKSFFGEQATVLHTWRDPRNIFVSLFLNSFLSKGMIWTTDMQWIKHYMRNHLALMKVWKSLGLRFENVFYEDLVIAPEPTISNILLAIGKGLKYDSSMLQFFKLNKRHAHTVSSLQLKRPLSSASIGRWHRYKHILPEEILAMGKEYDQMRRRN